jgi:uncharacterized protein with ParB-like and HNH nuclease domain
MARIENHKYSVEEAFRECFYIVPDYQREYVWTDREVNQLLDDINDAIDSASSKEYFIGTILVSPSSQKNHYEVIDGQQRLTTFFLMLCVLKHFFHNEPQCHTISDLISVSHTAISGDVQTSLKLEPRYENSGEIINKLVESDSDPDKTRTAIQAAGIKLYGTLNNLINAYDTVYRFFNHQDKAKLKQFWGYLANNVVFIQISADISSALKIFETVNERGIGLNSMDLLKNLLFARVKADEFSKLKDEWKKITNALEQADEKPLRFLRYFIMANYKIENKRNDAIIREDEIYDWLIDKKNAKICDYENNPFEFVRKIIKNVENYISYSTGKGNDCKDSIAMNNLKRLCGGAFSLHYVLLLAASNLPKLLFDHFIEQLESFLFYYIFTKTPTKDLERNFSLWSDELRDICDIHNISEQKQMLNNFIREKLEKNMKSKEGEINDDLKRYSLYSMQRYRTRYLLAKLTQFVDMAYKGLRVAGTLEDYAVLEIEHILPNTPKDELRHEFKKNNPDKDYDEYKNKLGNLTLLEKPINIVAGNDFFINKKEEYKKCKYYLTSSIAELNTVGNNSSINRINQMLESFNSWSAESIDKRQELLISLSKDIWKTKEINIE